MLKVDSKFKIGDDVYVLKHLKTRVGRRLIPEQIKIVRTPHSVTNEEIETLMNFFDLIAIKKFQ